MDIKIVHPDATYAAVLAELGARLFAETFSDDNPPDDLKSFLESTYTLEIQTQELNNPNVYTYMAYDAKDDTVPLAFCQLRQNKKVYEFRGDPEALELQRIYVDKRWAGKGVGKKLLNECIKKAEELGKKTIWLGVWENNLSAIKFYRNQGFCMVGTHTFQIGDKLDTDEIMVKHL